FDHGIRLRSDRRSSARAFIDYRTLADVAAFGRPLHSYPGHRGTILATPIAIGRRRGALGDDAKAARTCVARCAAAYAGHALWLSRRANPGTAMGHTDVGGTNSDPGLPQRR